MMLRDVSEEGPVYNKYADAKTNASFKIRTSIKGIFDLIIFFTPYSINKKLGPGNETHVFVKCVMLLTANVATILMFYMIITRSWLPIPTGSRSQARLVGLLSLISFAILYWLFRRTYKRKFSAYDNFSPEETARWIRFSQIYIYGTIVLFAIPILITTLWMWAKEVGFT